MAHDDVSFALNFAAGRRSVLVVDSDRPTQQVIKAVLERDGYEVRCAESVRVAMQLFKEQRPSVVLTDIHLIGKSGLDLLQQVRTLEPGIPVVILTGQTDLKNVHTALREGAFDFLQKPIQSEALPVVVYRAIMASTPTGKRFRRILVVDDDLLEANITQAALTDLGHEVVVLGSVREAKAAVKNSSFDVVITEVQMPVNSGTELLRELMPMRPEVPGLVVTRSTDIQVAISCLQAGAFDLLIKPVAEKLLVERVSRALEKREMSEVNYRQAEMRTHYESRLESLGATLEMILEEMSVELSRQKKLFDDVVGTVPLGLFITEADGRISHASPWTASLLGMEGAEVIGTRLDEHACMEPFRAMVPQMVEKGQRTATQCLSTRASAAVTCTLTLRAPLTPESFAGIFVLWDTPPVSAG
jgi:FixJ family two-component response regulator